MSSNQQTVDQRSSHSHEVLLPVKSTLPIRLAQLIWPLYVSFKYKGLRLHLRDGALQRLSNLKGRRVIICPNHSSEMDADVLFSISRLMGEPFYFLTAHEIFHGHHNGNILPLRLLGCFPIVRGMPDLEAYKLTKQLIVEGRRKLVVFPEGEISHQNNDVKHIQGGPARIALAALEKIMTIENEKDDDVLLLPVALRYIYETDISRSLHGVLKRVEQSLSITGADNSSLNLNDRLRNCFLALCQKEANRQGIAWTAVGSLNQSICALRKTSLRKIAQELQIEGSICDSWTELSAAHFVKSHICDLLYHWREHNGRNKQDRLRVHLRDVKKLIDLITLDFDKLNGPLTQEQAAEFVVVLERELFGRNSELGKVTVLIDAADPISVAEHRKLYGNANANNNMGAKDGISLKKARNDNGARSATVDQIDSLLHDRLQTMINSMEISRTKRMAT